MFLFQTGSIKRRLGRLTVLGRNRFLFQTGSIKSFAQPALILYYILILFVKFIFIFSFSRQIFVDRR